MSSRCRTPFLVLMLTLLFAAPATLFAQAESSEQKIRRLEQEVEVLKQKVSVLSQALAELRARLDVERPAPAVTGAAPRPAVTAAAPRPVREPNPLISSPPRPAPGSLEEKQPKPPTYASFQQLLSTLPSDLKPDARGGWSAGGADKARRWFKENVVGHHFKTRVALDTRQVGSITRDPGDEPRRPGEEEATRYRLDLTFTPQRFTYRGMLCEGHVLGGDGQAVSITVDQAFARRASLLRPGHFINIEGKIKAVEIPQAGSLRTSMNVLLTDYKVLSFKR